MLSELRVRDLGVIADVTLVLQAGMTVLTGETGAGKTLLVEAISLLAGGPAAAGVVRAGADHASVEARFAHLGPSPLSGPGDDSSEKVLSRVVPADGRSRAYLGGRMVAASQLGEEGAALVDIHGQHTHQSLLSPVAQRRALDLASGIDTTPLAALMGQVRSAREELATLGGDATARAREIDLLRYQFDEISRAHLDDPDEDLKLRGEEENLADVSGARSSALAAWSGLSEEGGVTDALARIEGELSGRPALGRLLERIASAREDLVDVAGEARSLGEGLEDDPERLDAIQARRRTLGELRRRYGGTLAEVMAFRDDLKRRLEDLEGYESRAEHLEHRIGEAEKLVATESDALLRARSEAAPVLARQVTARLRELAMPRASFEIHVVPTPEGGSVTWMLSANPGQPLQPLARVASGGELARTMLAARLAVLGTGRPENETGSSPSSGLSDASPATLVFDEVDAGVGGEAAVAVGRALHALSERYQVLVVTHLPQVAAFAEHHLVVRKELQGAATVASVSEVAGPDRVVELARMLSGRPDSPTARLHAEELLESAGSTRIVG